MTQEPGVGYYLCMDEFYFGYLINGVRQIRPFTTDDLAFTHWRERVHQFPNKRSAQEWLAATSVEDKDIETENPSAS